MQRGRPSVNEEEVIYADDGHREVLETIKTPLIGPGGELIGVLGIARLVVESMLSRFRNPFRIDARELVLTASAGIAVYPDDGDNPSELLRNADTGPCHCRWRGQHFGTV
jgi:GGDEF domain-containing protein